MTALGIGLATGGYSVPVAIARCSRPRRRDRPLRLGEEAGAHRALDRRPRDGRDARDARELVARHGRASERDEPRRGRGLRHPRGGGFGGQRQGFAQGQGQRSHRARARANARRGGGTRPQDGGRPQGGTSQGGPQAGGQGGPQAGGQGGGTRAGGGQSSALAAPISYLKENQAARPTSSPPSAPRRPRPSSWPPEARPCCRSVDSTTGIPCRPGRLPGASSPRTADPRADERLTPHVRRLRRLRNDERRWCLERHHRRKPDPLVGHPELQRWTPTRPAQRSAYVCGGVSG